jgi:hypothetical protein
MPDIDKSEIKRIIAALKGRKLPVSPAPRESFRPPISAKRRTAGKMVESVLAKTGLDLARIQNLVAEDQKAMRGAFDKQMAAVAKKFKTARAAFRSGMAARVEALKLLGLPHLSTFVNLDQPFLIWELPRPLLDIFITSEIHPLNSFVKILVNKQQGSAATRFVFFFFWRNPSDFTAVINVKSSLIVNGGCSVQATAGIFSGHRSSVDILATLTLMRWFGWGVDPVTGNSNNQTPHPDVQKTQFQQVTFLDAKGGHIFEGADFEGQSFSFEQFPLSHSLLVVPPKASLVFQVELHFLYALDPGGNIEDNVTVDFSNNGNAVFCPNVELEILTPLSNLIVA